GTQFLLQAAPGQWFTVTITDMAGRTVWRNKVAGGQQLDFSALSPAVYIFGVQNSSGEQTAGRIVMQYRYEDLHQNRR
ncbi:MAG: T9SS type A sorting domain-containing protein, partial [Bacteroidia bacterium]